jgi:hypothetical protein
MTPILGAAFIMGVLLLLYARSEWSSYYSILVLFLRKYTLVRTIVHAEDKEKENASADLEKGAGSEETGEREENDGKDVTEGDNIL